jgi:hypothetical protein
MKKLFLLSLIALSCVPAWCQGGKILFTSNRAGNGDIYVMNANGSGQTNLSNTASIEEGFARYRLDGGKIVYPRTDALWTMNPDGSNQAVLLQGGAPLFPDYHPSGSAVIFSRPFTSDYDICRVNDDGSGFSQILSNYFGDYYPRWSPDGSKFTFHTFNQINFDYLPDIYIANANGSNQTRLTFTGGNACANWSPDGRKLVYQAQTGGNYEIYVMNSNGTGQTRLTNNSAEDILPTFSPDGKFIAFVSDRDGNNEIYVMNANGTGQTRLTNNIADDTAPSWAFPLPANPPSLNISDATVQEGTGGTTNLNFTISLSAPSSGNVAVFYKTDNASATAPADYNAVAGGSVTFAPGETSKVISIAVQGDSSDEDDETLQVSLLYPAGAVLGDSSGIGTIRDNDGPPTLSIADAAQNEGDSNPTPYTLTVTVSQPSGKEITVDYATANGTATQPGDYAATTGTLIIPAGTANKTFTIPVVGDTVREVDETFIVTLSNSVNATLNDSQATATIVNDDFPLLSVSNVTVAEGNSGQVNALFTITLAETSSDVVSFDYSTASGTASSGVDFQVTNGSHTFQPGETTTTIAVPVLGDVLDEANEAFTLTLSNLVKADAGNTSGTGTITDDDAMPTISIADAGQNEGNNGIDHMTFTVSLSSISGRTVNVNYATSDLTATQPGDYIQRTGTATISAGSLTTTINVPIRGDTLVETPEQFKVTLSGSVNAILSDAEATGTITNDDLPMISISGSSVTETNDSGAVATFTLTLSEAYYDNVSVDFATTPGTATAGTDYTTTTGSRIFAPGQTTKTVTVPIIGDAIDENDETFFLTLSNAVNGTFAPSLPRYSATGHAYELVANALNWDAARTAAATRTYGGVAGHLATITSAEEQSFINTTFGTSRQVWLGGVQSADSPEPAAGFSWITGEAFSYTNWNGGEPNNGGGAEDVIELTNGVWNDMLRTNVRSYLVEYDLENFAGTNSAIIVDDDAAPQLSISDVGILEGNISKQAVFTISVGGSTAKSITVDAKTTNVTAVSGADYTGLDTTVIIPAGQRSATISVPVLGDALDEANETFLVELADPFNATIADAQGIGTITDNDATPSLSIADVSITEGNTGSQNLTFTVTLSVASGRNVNFNYFTANGTAYAGIDFNNASGTATIIAGQTTSTITVPILGDVLDEANEIFYVLLSSPVNAGIARERGVGTITDNDAAPSITVDNVTVVEGNPAQGAPGSRYATFTLRLSTPSGQSVRVTAQSANGTATAGSDYVALPPTVVSFTVGYNVAVARVLVQGDALDESNENFVLNLSSPVNAIIADNQGIASITDDDATPGLSINDVSISEGPAQGAPAGTKAMTFTVSLSAPSSKNISVNYASANGVARSTSDYVATNGTLSFAPGQTSKTISIIINGDTQVEGNETVYVLLTDAVNAGVSRGRAMGTILNDDASG